MAHTAQALVRALTTCAIAALGIWLAIGSVRSAKRHSTGAQLVAGAVLLVLGFTAPIVKRPQQGVEAARLDKGKKGAESGDPPEAASNADGRLPMIDYGEL